MRRQREEVKRGKRCREIGNERMNRGIWAMIEGYEGI
jgi:hypothetical protein